MRLIKIITILISFFFLFNAEAQIQNKKILLKINGEKTTVDTFLKSYHKNYKQDSKTKATTISEYLDLYINYRLKVIEAKTLMLDTISRLKLELDGYVKALAEPYFIDKQKYDALIDEAFRRLLIDVRASHILIRCDENANPVDTLQAYQKIVELRKRAMAGEDFGLLASKLSDDLSARDQINSVGRIIKKGNAGDLGFFSVFDMVYPFENATYETPIGEISEPIRTRFGYHIIKPIDHHQAMGKATVAHIFLAESNPSMETQKNKIFEVFNKLKEGVAFEKLVQEYSEDQLSKIKNGVLPTYVANEIVPEFYLAIFSLNTPGEYSKPFKTEKGWHIIKLLELNKPGNFNEEKASLINKIKKDKRDEISQVDRFEFIKQKIGFYSSNTANDELFTIIASEFSKGKRQADKTKKLNGKLFRIGKQGIKQYEFAQFIFDRQPNDSELNKESYQIFYDKFVNETCEKYFYENIANIFPVLKNTLDEYWDGILLFEVSNIKVWKKSVKDEDGLNAFFKSNPTKYSNSNLNEIKGTVIADYQNQLEKNWVKNLRTNHLIKINEKTLSKIINE